MLCDLCCSSWLFVAVGVYFLVRWLRSPAAPVPRAPFGDVTRRWERGSGKPIRCQNPGTGEPLGEVKAYTKDEVVAAYNRAKQAQIGERGWGNTTFEERRVVLRDIMEWVLANRETVIKWSTQESGKTVTEATLGEVMTSCEKIRWLCAEGESCLAPEGRRVPTLLAFGKQARVEYSPLGVIGIIVPWNYPFHNVLSAVVAALFAGNGAVCKVSEYASFCAGPIEDMFRSILSKRGYNPELVQIIQGFGETGAALVQSGVDKVLFIGSPAVGKKVMEGASATLTPVILELGGKDPFIVFSDCEFDHMIEIAIRGAFINCGQNCISAERFYIEEPLYDKFVAEIERRTKSLRQGTPGTCDFGSMTMPAQVGIVDALVQDAISKGARLLKGGKSIAGTPENSLYYGITILADVNHTMRIANEEAFGPVMTIMKFSDEKDLMDKVNCTEFGLGSSVFTTDYKKADRVAKQIHSGMVNINDYGTVPLIQSLPFGGVKYSGFGAFNGKEGLRGFSHTKSVVTDRFPFRMAAPGFLCYPVQDNSHLIAQQAILMVYSASWIASAKALVAMIGLLVGGSKQAPKKQD